MDRRRTRNTTFIEGVEPVFRTRTRIEHRYTQKEGYAYETTVEVEWEARESDLDEVADAADTYLREELARVRQTAIRERDARNKELIRG